MAGAFRRRFGEFAVMQFMQVINRVPIKIWQQHPDAFVNAAIIEADGTTVETWGPAAALSDNFVGNWADMAIVSLAWSLNIGPGLVIRATGLAKWRV